MFKAFSNYLRPLYIFDIDGTLALCDHRIHLLENKEDKKCWDNFFLACVDDEPNLSILSILNTLSVTSDIYFWTGRSELVKQQTIDWLNKHTFLEKDYIENNLKMNTDGARIKNHVLKQEWYFALPEDDKKRLVSVFDDCNDVVQMWRNLNVTCCQVALSDY